MSPDIPNTESYNFRDTETRFSLMAKGGASYSRSLGGHDENQHLDASSGFIDPDQNEVDLQTQYGYSKYVMWHGAQFRGALSQQRDYWKDFLKKIGIMP